MEEKAKNRFKYLITLLFLALLFLPAPGQAAGASLYFSPSAGSYEVGQSFSLSLYVSSQVQAMNAASGVISYPQDLLEVSSISRDGSIISLWVQEPVFSNTTGSLNFEGIVLNPGFTGSVGKLIKINFRVLGAGQATVSLTSGMVLANDGRGTNILSTLGQASLSINQAQVSSPPSPPPDKTPFEPAPQPPAPTPTLIKPKTITSSPATGTPRAPEVYSTTHPQSDKWYSANTATFDWQLPAGVTGVNILADQNPTSNPGVESDGLFDSYTYPNVADGSWYFHIRFRNASGWGDITHFGFQIDTLPPEPFEIIIIDGQESFNPRPTILFNTVDELSGVAYYKIKIGDHEFNELPEDEIKQNPYTLPPQSPGRHIMLVQAFDRAGNYTASQYEFEVKALLTPVLTDVPPELRGGQPIVVRGNTYPDALITLWLQGTQGRAEAYQVDSDEHGDFAFAMEDGLAEGVYQLWAEVKDQDGYLSNPTDKYIIIVRKPKLLQLGDDFVSALSIFVPLISLLIVFAFILYLSWQKFHFLKKRVRTQIWEAQYNLGQAFDVIRHDLKQEIQLLEKAKKRRKLTKEEIGVEDRLKSSLDKIEELLIKEIGNIRKELK